MSVRTDYTGSHYFLNQADDGKDAKKDTKPEYKIVISTEVNGRTIAQKTEKVPPPPIFLDCLKSAGFSDKKKAFFE